MILMTRVWAHCLIIVFFGIKRYFNSNSFVQTIISLIIQNY